MIKLNVATNQQLNNHAEECTCNDCLPFDMEECESVDHMIEWAELDVKLGGLMEVAEDDIPEWWRPRD